MKTTVLKSEENGLFIGYSLLNQALKYTVYFNKKSSVVWDVIILPNIRGVKTMRHMLQKKERVPCTSAC